MTTYNATVMHPEDALRLLHDNELSLVMQQCEQKNETIVDFYKTIARLERQVQKAQAMINELENENDALKAIINMAQELEY